MNESAPGRVDRIGAHTACAVKLVRAGRVDELREVVAAGQEQATGPTPQIYVCPAAAGAGEVTPTP